MSRGSERAAGFTVTLLLLVSGARASHAPEALDEIVVTATRAAAGRFELPMSIDRIDQRQVQSGQLQINLSETLNALAGVSAQNRQNYAQDLQVSVRGFGARSSFGVRGVRLYADGIPGTMPDGQGQFSHFDLGSAARIEVLRGPFSALYGNSSGGVIAIFTESAPATARADATAAWGGFGTRRYALKSLSQLGGMNLVVDAAHFTTDGYRTHSAAERNTFNAKARWQLDQRSTVTLIANALDSPNAQDPLGLNRAQLQLDPRQAGTNALTYNTRKSLRQQQVGISYDRNIGRNDDLAAMIYGGHRRVTQFQSIPKPVELAAAAHPGGVIDLGRNYWGADLHFTTRRAWAGRPMQITTGVSFDNLDESRQGFYNFSGSQLGVIGTLRRSESNRVYDLDEYLQAQWDLHARWRLLAGARHNLVDVSSRNRLLTDSSRNGVRYSALNPVAGLTYRVTSTLNLYGSYGKGFETPTLNELAYRSTDGSVSGLNLGLRPARSDNYEFGLKTLTAAVRTTAALFYIRTRDELAVAVSSGGRTVFKNIAATRRKGAEFELVASLPKSFTSRLAYTHIEAATTAGRRLPAVPQNTLYAAVTWQPHPEQFSASLEILGRTQIFVDDVNSDAAAGNWVTNLHCEWGQRHGAWNLAETLRVDNITDRHYVGSVIVNESNKRFFEPEPGRSVYLVLTASSR